MADLTKNPGTAFRKIGPPKRLPAPGTGQTGTGGNSTVGPLPNTGVGSGVSTSNYGGSAGVAGQPKPASTTGPSPATPPKVAGPKPMQAGESQASYDKRSSNWQMSQDRLKSVGITGGVNKANAKQLNAFSTKYGHGPSGLKPKPAPKTGGGTAKTGPSGGTRRYGSRQQAAREGLSR